MQAQQDWLCAGYVRAAQPAMDTPAAGAMQSTQASHMRLRGRDCPARRLRPLEADFPSDVRLAACCSPLLQ